MRRFLIPCIVLSGMLIGLPLLGITAGGLPLQRYLEFPPVSRYIRHPPFSWPVFALYLIFILAWVLPVVIRGVRAHGVERPNGRPARSRFPWWGWAGLASGTIAWILAWTRFPWFSALQPHTFTPLWLSLILVVNALAVRHSGRCLMLDRPRFFLVLFPFSALFWWFFEYLNRFVQNWYYIGRELDPLEYFVYATLPFSTVLPAVLSVREWMNRWGWLGAGFRDVFPVRLRHPKPLAAAVLCLSGFGLAGIGVWPNLLFPLLWVSPLLIVVSLQALMGQPHVFSGPARGDWRPVVSSALAALFCGIFWETWNFFSLAKWKYTVPYVQRFHLFEMPLLGYAGYLPFGLECLTVGKLLEGLPIFSRTDPEPG